MSSKAWTDASFSFIFVQDMSFERTLKACMPYLKLALLISKAQRDTKTLRSNVVRKQVLPKIQWTFVAEKFIKKLSFVPCGVVAREVIWRLVSAKDVWMCVIYHYLLAFYDLILLWNSSYLFGERTNNAFSSVTHCTSKGRELDEQKGTIASKIRYAALPPFGRDKKMEADLHRQKAINCGLIYTT